MAFPLVQAVFCKGILHGGMLVGGTVGSVSALSIWAVDMPRDEYNNRVFKIKCKLRDEQQAAAKSARTPDLHNGTNDVPKVGLDVNLGNEKISEVEQRLFQTNIVVPDDMMPPPLTPSEVRILRAKQFLAGGMIGLAFFGFCTALSYGMVWRTSSYLRSRLGTSRRDIVEKLEKDRWFAWKMGTRLPAEYATGFTLVYFGFGMLCVAAFQPPTAIGLFWSAATPFFVVPIAVAVSAPLTWPIGISVCNSAVRESLKLLKDFPEQEEEEGAQDDEGGEQLE